MTGKFKQHFSDISIDKFNIYLFFQKRGGEGYKRGALIRRNTVSDASTACQLFITINKAFVWSLVQHMIGYN